MRTAATDYACPAWRFVVSCRRLLVRHLDDERNRRAVPAAPYFKRRSGMSDSPMRLLAGALRQNGLVRFFDHFNKLFPNSRNHLKDLVVDRMGPNRIMEVEGRTVVNFGSDSFPGPGPGPARSGGGSRAASNLGRPQRRVARLQQRPRQHRRRGQAGRLARHGGDA